MNNQESEAKAAVNPLICIHDIVVSYQNVVALANIDFDIFPGEILGICGPNGSGKSSLLKAILGLIPLSRGTIKFFQSEELKRPFGYKGRVKNIGYVPQVKNIDRNFPALVKDVVAMGRYGELGFFKGVKKDDISVEKALEATGMWRFRHRPIGHLSGGQQQKVMISRALAGNPQVLLLDEPTAALDFRVEKDIMELIKELHEEKNLTILLVTHKMSFLRDYTTRVICIDKSLVWKGHPHDPKLQTIINNLFFM